MKVKDCMNTGVVTIGSHADTAEALQVMLKHKISSLPVIDEHNCLVGFVTKKDIATTAEENLDMFPIDQVMTKNIISVQSDDMLKTALDYMLNDKINRLPVVRDHKLVGIITRNDVINYYYGRG
jgi:tRNA nucleotidyltransferase (CCA-adding enzyme)